MQPVSTFYVCARTCVFVRVYVSYRLPTNCMHAGNAFYYAYIKPRKIHRGLQPLPQITGSFGPEAIVLFCFVCTNKNLVYIKSVTPVCDKVKQCPNQCLPSNKCRISTDSNDGRLEPRLCRSVRFHFVF